MNLPATLLLSLLPSQGQDAAPRTTPEATGYQATSRHGDVDAFLSALEDLPAADRLERSVFGKSHEGRDLWLVQVQDPARPWSGLDDPRLRLLVIGNIHAGEVEGKEALQEILRELSLGQHGELLAEAALFFVPVYNADGNEPIDRGNRVTQNGPEQGVGQRPNAQGYDLNRDFIKADSPECRAMLGLFDRLDPHLFVDLHTTNGTYHGYHLTYAPSLSTNVDPDLDAFAREDYLPAVTEALGKEGWRIFHYGNAGRAATSWGTYDHRPRFGTNYYGLRGRLSVLSEAYSYLDFERRIAVTRAFILELLRQAVAEPSRLRDLCAAADARALDGGLEFGYDTQLAEGFEGEILMGEIEELELEGLGTRRIARDVAEPVEMQIRVAFESRATRPLPAAWAIVHPPPAVLERLTLHGIEHRRIDGERNVEHQKFEVNTLRRAPRPFQQHHEISVEGRWREDTEPLPAGTVIVPARQRLARLAAQLLEPESEDSLLTWNLFGDWVGITANGGAGRYPVLRLSAVPEEAGR